MTDNDIRYAHMQVYLRNVTFLSNATWVNIGISLANVVAYFTIANENGVLATIVTAQAALGLAMEFLAKRQMAKYNALNAEYVKANLEEGMRTP